MMFATAAAAVGPHGAGMSNIVMMRAGGSVFEFLPVHGTNRLNVCFLVLARSLGLRYLTDYSAESNSEGEWAVDADAVAQTLSPRVDT